MITLLEAQAIAKSHAENEGEIFPGFYYDMKNGKEYSQCYYFDYAIVDAAGNVPKEPFAGAPGITVDKKSGEINIITWENLSKLK